jgi:hypothetical protein
MVSLSNHERNRWLAVGTESRDHASSGRGRRGSTAFAAAEPRGDAYQPIPKAMCSGTAPTIDEL